jgi:cytochrome c oxidase subunit III
VDSDVWVSARAAHGDVFAWSVSDRTCRLGIWMGLAGITMLFTGLTSAMVVRRGMSLDWVDIPLPRVLYLNTIFLLLSGLTLELARRGLRAGLASHFRLWTYGTLALGLAFASGQVWAWKELMSRGVCLATNPSSSFFYLLTGVHGIHLLGGIIALAYLTLVSRGIAAGRRRRVMLDVTAIYWHFLDGLWVYLLLLLTVKP